MTINSEEGALREVLATIRAAEAEATAVALGAEHRNVVVAADEAAGLLSLAADAIRNALGGETIEAVRAAADAAWADARVRSALAQHPWAYRRPEAAP